MPVVSAIPVCINRVRDSSMPTNVSAEYKRAEAEFKSARERANVSLLCGRCSGQSPSTREPSMCRGDIKKKIKELTDELAGPKKGGARGGPPTTIRAEGAGQIGLLGPPNSGKSTLHDALTGSGATVGPYDFTTQYPQPGMLLVEDVGIQLIDLPSRSHPIIPSPGSPTLCNRLQGNARCRSVASRMRSCGRESDRASGRQEGPSEL